MGDAEKVCSLILKDLSCSALLPGAVGAAAATDRAVAAAGWDLDLQAALLAQAQGQAQQEQEQLLLRQQAAQRPATAGGLQGWLHVRRVKPNYVGCCVPKDLQDSRVERQLVAASFKSTCYRLLPST